MSTEPTPPRRGRRATRAIVLGMRQNLAQFILLVAVNAMVGGTLGQERTVLPLLAHNVFHLNLYISVLTYILAFGVAKASTNYFAGILSDRYGRKPVLVAGWLVAIPIPFLLILGPSWAWIVAANVILGINQGLTWSTTVVMKIDIVGPARRGLAIGLNEASGYLGLAATALATGYIAGAYGLRPGPFLLGAAYIAVGLGLSLGVVKETREFARLEAKAHVVAHEHAGAELTTGEVFTLTSFRDRSLSAVSQAGMVTNLKDGLAWGLFPLLFTAAGISVTRIGILVAVYPAVWGAGQLITGFASDRYGRKSFIVVGMLLQAGALGMTAIGHSFGIWAVAAILLGVGTALVYPTLLAAVSDVAHPIWRARSLGIYRLWRDGGFAVGALVSGFLADAFGIPTTVAVVAALAAISGILVAVRMRATDYIRPGQPTPPIPDIP